MLVEVYFNYYFYFYHYYFYVLLLQPLGLTL